MTMMIIRTMRSAALLSLLITVVAVATAAAADASSSSISLHSAAGRRLLASAWQENGNGDSTTTRRSLADNGQADYSFLADYSIKFQGCHHVQQWNDEAGDDGDEDNDVKIMTKRLARFRLCPTDLCSHDKSAGCTSKYGDYVVDMDTFVQAYLQALQEDQQAICAATLSDCVNNNGCDNDDYGCLESCFDNYQLVQTCYYDYYGYVSSSYSSASNGDDDDGNGDDDGVQEGGGAQDFDVAEYAACANFDLPDNNNNNNNNNNGGRNRQLEDNANNNNGNDVEYYIGAFCADQGGEIHLGLFTDDTCTTFASNGYNLFKSSMGFALPFSESSLVTNRCLACGENYNDGGDGNNNNNYNGEAREVCTAPYELAGKCETRMANVDYPNESSCNYIEGIKIIREDGVIRTSATKKSKAAAVAIGLFTTVAVLLAAYVFYLRTKLARAQINLAASAQPLT